MIGSGTRIVAGLAAGIIIIIYPLFTLPSYANASPTDSISIGNRDDGYSPFDVAVNQATNTVYVTSPDSNTVSVINATTNKVVDTITVGITPVEIAVNLNTNLVYVANGNSGTISIIDGSTNKVLKTLSVTDKRDFYSIGGIAVNENTNKVYVLVNNDLAEPAYASILIIDGLTNNLEQTFNVAELRLDYDVRDGARGIAVNPETNMIYVTMIFGSLHVIDGSNNKVVASLATGRMPHQVEVNKETNLVYVSNFNSQSVSVIDGSTNKIIKTVRVGPDPQGIAIDRVTNTIYVAGGSGVVSIINGSSHQVENKVEIGSFPAGVAFNQNNELLYVAKWQSDSVFVINVDDNENDNNDGGSVMPLSPLRQNTASGKYIVELGWEFKNAGNVTLLVFFFDSSGAPLDYVQYDLFVRNASNGEAVQQFIDQIPALYATPNIGYHDIAFEKGGNNIQIDVIIEASSQELVSNDKATFDIVVVPEFNLSILATLVMAISMAIGIVTLKMKWSGMKI